MNLISFLEHAGEKLVGRPEPSLAVAPQPDVSLNATAGQATTKYIASQNLSPQARDVKYDGASHTVTVGGVVSSQATKKESVLCCGSLAPIDQLTAAAAPSAYVTVRSGDTLSRVAKGAHGDAEPRAIRSTFLGTQVPKLFRAMRRALRAVLLGLIALVVFIEEWGWGPLSALVAQLARWPPIAVVESHIRRAPPRVALALFLLPALSLVPIKLLAIYLIEDGRVTLGILIIAAAKLVGTALVGRLFVLVEKQLMEFVWFARCVAWWRVTRDRIMAAVRASFLWRNGRALRRRWRNWLRPGNIVPASPSSPGDLAASRSFASPVVSKWDGRDVLRHVGAGLLLVPSIIRGSAADPMMVKLLTFALRVGLVVLLMNRALKTVTESVEQKAGAPFR